MRIKDPDWGSLPPTPDQLISITRASIILREPPKFENIPRTRREAQNIMDKLWGKVRLKGRGR